MMVSTMHTNKYVCLLTLLYVIKAQYIIINMFAFLKVHLYKDSLFLSLPFGKFFFCSLFSRKLEFWKLSFLYACQQNRLSLLQPKGKIISGQANFPLQPTDIQIIDPVVDNLNRHKIISYFLRKFQRKDF